MDTIDAYIMYEGYKFDLIYRNSVYWLMDGEGFNYFHHKISEKDLLDVVTSHINCAEESKPSLYLELMECLGEFEYYNHPLCQDKLLEYYGGYTIVGDDDVIIDNFEKEGKYLKFNLKRGGHLHIAEGDLEAFELDELLSEDLDEEIKKSISYDTLAIDTYIYSENYKDLIIYLREAVAKMNDVYERNGLEQIIIVD